LLLLLLLLLLTFESSGLFFGIRNGALDLDAAERSSSLLVEIDNLCSVVRLCVYCARESSAGRTMLERVNALALRLPIIVIIITIVIADTETDTKVKRTITKRKPRDTALDSILLLIQQFYYSTERWILHY
jgi:hypothetical protein